MIDGFNRTIDYVRLSVTDRCNLRCRYCMPPDGISCLPMREILTYEEIEHLCRIFADLGIHKVKITGGEPFVRKNICHLVRRIKQIAATYQAQEITEISNEILEEL